MRTIINNIGIRDWSTVGRTYNLRMYANQYRINNIILCPPLKGKNKQNKKQYVLASEHPVYFRR